MFYKNLRVSINDNKIISNQNGGTPGVYKYFQLKGNTKYMIELVRYEFGECYSIPILWIGNYYNNTLYTERILNSKKLYYESRFSGLYKIGVLFKSARINNYFYLDDIKIVEQTLILPITKPIVESVNKPIKVSNTNVQNLLKKESSIIIPCHYRHFQYIDKLLRLYEQQTVLPLEIIIVLCEYKKLNNNQITAIENNKYAYDLKIIKIEKKSPAGNNRYIGSKESRGNIIIFQDADDIPHSQRIEMIEYFFKKYPDIMHICHGYSRFVISKRYNPSNVKYEIYAHNMFLNHKEMASYNLTNGNIGIRRNIVEKVKWEKTKFRGQDVAFNRNIYQVYKKFLLIKLPLYVYREHLTTRYNR